MKISLADAAYTYLKQIGTSVPFQELYQAAADMSGLAEDLRKRKKSSFYSSLSLDERFTQRENNTWDLTEHHSYEETHIRVDQMDGDDDEDDEISDIEESDELSEDGEETENSDRDLMIQTDDFD